MDFHSAAEWLEEMSFARSYTKTERLEQIAKDNPEVAEQIEALCRAVLALRGPAIVSEAHSSLRYAATAMAPFVTMDEVFDKAMANKASSDQARAAVVKRWVKGA